MRLTVRTHIAAAVVALALLPKTSAADWVVTPYVGPAFGTEIGSLAVGSALGTERKMTYGGSLGFLGPAFLGLEVDLGHSPAFFEGDTVLQNVVRTSVTTVMANALIGGPRGRGLAPYVSGGLGLIRLEVGDPFNLVRVRDTSPGMNAGAGMMAFVSDHVGLRTDLRYFRTMGDQDNGVLGFLSRDLSFWRGTVGVTLRF